MLEWPRVSAECHLQSNYWGQSRGGKYLGDTLEAVDRERNETSSVVSEVPHTWVTTQKVRACRGLCCKSTQGPSWDALVCFPHLLT